MRVFSQINNCHQKQNKKQKQKTDKTKRGAPLLGLAKSIYYCLMSGSNDSNNHAPVTRKACAWSCL